MPSELSFNPEGRLQLPGLRTKKNCPFANYAVGEGITAIPAIY